ncbi:MAG: glutamate-5-semialdehyde dehydrogenase [Solirubrobacterales bacterium]|nr:glutamate-5-semialdehyde dehydrogenase [Solirubrobacterales bacterium]MCB8969744.1 glutamate-5-semialdehyde dehydrogenase [Thermoleophilales bacterium]MCO5327161.1 glutamate-5-semialdehyde dehydrogenase [Solirubrobacterales bacterium]
MAVTTESVTAICRRARAASLLLPSVPTEVKDEALRITARLLRERTEEILEANGTDLERGEAAGLDAALIDRLRLDEARIEAMAVGVEAIIALPDPVGEVIDRRTIEGGVELEHLRVPIGVVAIVYEARPNVTIDAAALCLKSGNAAILRGSSSAAASNAVLGGIVKEAVAEAGMPEGTIEMVAGGGREELADLARQRSFVDLIIPRGGEGLKAALEQVAEVPILYAASGNCHVYVHEDADPEMARRIILNAKVQRPGVCNAAETLLVHRAIAARFLPDALAELSEAAVELVGDDAARQSSGAVEVGKASDEDWDTEYHALKLAVGVVDSLEDAIDHVNEHGSGHSEAIVTSSREAGDLFASRVDAACVYVNASTRFTDGFVFGMGAEIGNSTQKLHARGPIGLRELTSTKYVGRGTGQTRA